MWLILCEPEDAAAHWTYQGLRARGLQPLCLVTSTALVGAVRWHHRLGEAGVNVQVELPDGLIIDGSVIRGVLNRLPWVSPAHAMQIATADREYALQEWSAFYLSWLYALPGAVLNRPTPQGLAGRWRHASEWTWLAGLAGLPTQPYQESGKGGVTAVGSPDPGGEMVIVVGRQVVGARVPIHIRQGCVRLAQAAGTSLLGVQFTANAVERWIFAGATNLPDLRAGGEPVLAALTQELQDTVEDGT